MRSFSVSLLLVACWLLSRPTYAQSPQPQSSRSAAPTPVRTAGAARPKPARPTRPADLTVITDLTGEALQTALTMPGSSYTPAVVPTLREGRVVLESTSAKNSWSFLLPEALARHIADRQAGQNLLLEARVRILNPAVFGVFGLTVDPNDHTRVLTATCRTTEQQWSSTDQGGYQQGPLPGTGSAGADGFHTLGLFVRQDSAQVWLDDVPMSRVHAVGDLLAQVQGRNGTYKLTLDGRAGQVHEVAFVRLSAQGEAAAARARAEHERTAAAYTASQPAPPAAAVTASPASSGAVSQSGNVSSSSYALDIFKTNAVKVDQRAARANEPRVRWLYAVTYETLFALSGNKAYQIVYAYVDAPASATRDEVMAAIPAKAIRAGVGMSNIGSTLNQCTGGNCAAALNHYAVGRNTSTSMVGQYRVE